MWTKRHLLCTSLTPYSIPNHTCSIPQVPQGILPLAIWKMNLYLLNKVPSLSGFLLLRGKVLRPLMPHPQDKHEFTFQYLSKSVRSILSMLQRSMKGLCAIKTFNSKRHQQTWKKSKPRLSQESWTWWVKPPLGTKVSHKQGWSTIRYSLLPCRYYQLEAYCPRRRIS